MSLSYGLSSKTMESASASSQQHEQNPDFTDYLLIFFDINRGGFFDVAQKILKFLDYKSLVMFKRTCKSIYEFNANCDIEKVKFNAKIRNDWKIGTHKEQTNNAPGLVSSARIYENGRKIICGADESIFVVDSLTSNRLLTLPGHNSIVNSVDLFSIKDEHFIASGSQDGILAIYALETGECLCQKQLFGRIEVVKAKDDILATAHFGKDYDMGCITVRRIVSASDLPVIFSIYQDLYPVFCMDFSDDYLAALEWNATYNNVHAGNILVFPMLESRLLENLSEELTSFTACRFLQEEEQPSSSAKLLTGGHDKFVRLWNVTSTHLVCLRAFKGHSNVIVRLVLKGDLAASRDLDGRIFIWDVNQESDDKALLRKVQSLSRTVTCIAMDERRLVMGSIGQFSVYDYWNGAKVNDL